MKGTTTVSRIIVLLVIGLMPLAAAAGGHVYQPLQLPTYTMPTMPSYQPPSYHVSPVPTYQLPTYQWAPAPSQQPTYRQPGVDLQGILDSLRMPARDQRMIERGNRNQRRNSITTTGCHRYNIACRDELRSLD